MSTDVFFIENMYNPPIIRKAIAIIKLIVEEDRPLGVTEIARTLSINKSTAFGILKALQEEELIVRDSSTKQYAMGPGLFQLSKMIFKRTDLTSVARPFLEDLMQLVDETVFLGVRQDDTVKILDVIEAKKDFKISSPVGTKLPITAGAVGKVFLSLMSNEDLICLLENKGLPRYTEGSVTDLDLFLEEIEKTRSLGYGIDLEEYIRGIRAVAALIRSGAHPVAAIWVVGFTSSMTDEKLRHVIRHLTRTAELMSTRIASEIVPAYIGASE